MKRRVTEDDRALATRLIEAKGNMLEVAKVIADIHERALLCAMVRVEREFGLTRPTEQPGTGDDR